MFGEMDPKGIFQHQHPDVKPLQVADTEDRDAGVTNHASNILCHVGGHKPCTQQLYAAPGTGYNQKCLRAFASESKVAI